MAVDPECIEERADLKHAIMAMHGLRQLKVHVYREGASLRQREGHITLEGVSSVTAMSPFRTLAEWTNETRGLDVELIVAGRVRPEPPSMDQTYHKQRDDALLRCFDWLA